MHKESLGKRLKEANVTKRKRDLARITEDKKLVKSKKASRGAKEPRKIEFFSGGEK